MGYDETLASRIHSLLVAIGPCDRSGMFGAVAFTVNGNIAAGVEDSSVFMRVGESHAVELLKLPGVKPWPQDGKPQKGWIVLTPNAVAPTVVMRERLGWAYKAAAAMPPKEVQRRAAPPPPPPPPAPPPSRTAAPRRASHKSPSSSPPPLPVTSVIAPGMSRPLAPPSRFPYNPEAARSAPPPLVSKAVKPKVRPPESSERGRLEAGMPGSIAPKKPAPVKAAPPAEKAPEPRQPSKLPPKPKAGPAPRKPSSPGGASAGKAPRGKLARAKPTKPARKGAKPTPTAKKGGKKKK